MFTKDDAKKGKFAFTEDEYDVVDVCFSFKSPDGELIFLRQLLSSVGSLFWIVVEFSLESMPVV